MCGIVGLFDPKGRGMNPSALDRAGNTLNHRGPDDAGVYTDAHANLVFRRLSIIDLEAGAQPMCNEDGSIWMVYNGEIYNFQSLRNELERKGHRFKSRSDSEVILHLYEEEGDAFIKQLDGMFAFALWDRKNKRLILGRDRVGIKPLYYAHTSDGQLGFASELKALLEIPGISRTIDETALSHYLTFRYVPGTHSMFQGVCKLAAGHLIEASNGNVHAPRPYWDLAFESQPERDDQAWIEDFDARLGQSVSSHMVSDVPVGVLLSGGLDSAAMVAYAREAGTRDLKTFSVAFDVGEPYDERPFARQAARAFGTDHHEVVVSASDFARDLMDVVWHSDEPLADLATVPLYAVSRLAREHVTVLLSGEGSDELFGGYPGVEHLLKRADWMAWPAALRRLASIPVHLYPEKARWARALAGRPQDFARNLGLTMTSVFDASEKAAIHAGSQNGISEAYTDRVYEGVDTPDPLNQILYMYAKTWLPDDLLAKADRMTMANSLELRVPFLDNNLIDFASGMPQRLKVRRERSADGWQRKYVLRKALEGTVPQEIIDRPKQGFPVPAYGWLADELKGFAREWLMVDNLSGLGFRGEQVNRILTRATAGNARAQRQAWSLIVLAIWSERYLT